jgi:hypothetical protein
MGHDLRIPVLFLVSYRWDWLSSAYIVLRAAPEQHRHAPLFRNVTMHDARRENSTSRGNADCGRYQLM